MKKCSYCGAEYPDETVVCPIDQTPFEKDYEPVVENESKTPPVRREIPASLTVASYLFFTAGVLILTFNALIYYLGAPIQLNILLGIFTIFISRGLRRCSRGWRICALVVIWWGFIGFAWTSYKLLSRYFQAVAHKPFDEYPIGIYATPADKLPVNFLVILVVLVLIQVWMYRVLTRPEVRELFYSEP